MDTAKLRDNVKMNKRPILAVIVALVFGAVLVFVALTFLNIPSTIFDLIISTNFNNEYSVKSQTFTFNKVQTSIVMPCTIGEALTSLPMALKSVAEGDGMPHETLVIFGLKNDETFENALENVLPQNISSGVDKARDMLRHFILQMVSDRSSPKIEESFQIDKETHIETVQPVDYLMALKTAEFVESVWKSEWKDNHEAYRYLYNMNEYYKDYPDINDILAKLPPIKFILNHSEKTYANSQRERGTYDAFNGSDPDDEQIISFLDCDDAVSPVRLKWIEQVFSENSELHEFVGGWRHISLQAQKEEQMERCNDFNFKDMICDPLPEGGYSDEEYDALFDSQFDFRNEDIKNEYYRRSHSFEFLRNVNDPSIINNNPWDPDDGNLNGGLDYSWWTGCRQGVAFTDLPGQGRYHNGHSSWRRSWLINKIKKFPNTRIGQDSRLTYSSLLEGGNTLGTTYPLTLYSMPQGFNKRKGLAHLMDWNVERNKNDNEG